jgi:SAM-dependent MidA family methyltransferase
MEPENMAIRTMAFRDYMEWSLFDPDIGYYTCRAKIGLSGSDFITAPEVSPVFSLLISEQIIELDDYLGNPEKFYLIEAGPGNGTMMRSVLTCIKLLHPHLFERVCPMMIETSPFLRQQQFKRLSSLSLKNAPVWMEMNSLPVEKVAGVILGNEFLDALPAHWIRMAGGGLEEVYVEVDADRVLGHSYEPLVNRDIVNYLDWIGVELPEGCETDISIDAISVLGKLDSILDRGFMLWIDYGDSASEKYSQRRSRGTIRGFKDHQLIDQVFDHPAGSIDLTAHVDFSGVMKRLVELGHRFEGYSDQMSYLIALGIDQVLQENQLSKEEVIAASTLFHPLQMGRVFKVLLTSKGIGPKKAMKGFPRESLLPLLMPDRGDPGLFG